jgi:hypothetical protein
MDGRTYAEVLALSCKQKVVPRFEIRGSERPLFKARCGTSDVGVVVLARLQSADRLRTCPLIGEDRPSYDSGGAWSHRAATATRSGRRGIE